MGLLLFVWVAYANGSNDVSKAIATLVGSGVSNYRRAIVWGTATTFLGGPLSALTGTALVAPFSSPAAGANALMGWLLAAQRHKIATELHRAEPMPAARPG